MVILFYGKGKAKDVFRLLAKVALADRILEGKFGKRIETQQQLEPGDFGKN
jgi:hypothetical protein